MEILILDDCNSHEAKNPYATLVSFELRQEVNPDLFMQGMKMLERNQPGAGRIGGKLPELLQDLRKFGIVSEIKTSGRESDFPGGLTKYRLISGNY